MLEVSSLIQLVLAAVAVLAAHRYLTARRPANSFPYVMSWIPFFGASFHFRNGPIAPLQEYTATHGPVFNLTVLGKTITYVTDATLFPPLVKCPALGLFPLKIKFYERVFGSTSHDDPDVFGFLAKHTRQNILTHLSGTSLAQWTAKSHTLFQARVAEGLTRPSNGSSSNTVSVYSWLSPKVFATLVDTFYGQGMCTSAFTDDFDLLESKIVALYAGAPAKWLKVTEPRQRLLLALREYIETNTDMVTPIVGERWKFCHEKQVDQAAYQLAFVWAMTSNVVRTLFWLLCHLQESPDAWSAVEAEVRACAQKGALSEAVQGCPLLDSAVKETLRLRFSGSVLRVAVAHATVDLPNGTQLSMQPGDEIMLWGGLGYHDPARFPNPHAFQFDRFAQHPELGKDFRPFGLGKFNCPGQFFAVEFVKVALATLILGTDITQFEGKAMPNFATAGVFAPKDAQAVRMCIRPRTGAALSVQEQGNNVSVSCA